MGIRIGSPEYNLARPWLTYFERRTHSICQDFPHLRRMTIILHPRVALESATILRSISEKLGERSLGLEWVLVLVVDDDQMLDYFEPLVDRRDESWNGTKTVRRLIWENGICGQFRNALLMADNQMLDCVEPLVNRKDESRNGKKTVRRLVWTHPIRSQFKNALLWWGCPGEALPQKYRAAIVSLQMSREWKRKNKETKRSG